MPELHGFAAATILLMLAGCPLPPATVDIEDPKPPEPPLVFSERETSVTEVPTVTEFSGIEPGECPAEIADYPAPYFDTHVLIRLPAGVTEDNFVEFAPYFARLSQEVESTNCQPDMPGAMIYYMAMFMSEDEPSKSIDALRAELLDTFGYPRNTTQVAHATFANERSGMWVYEVPPTDPKPDPAKILLVMLTDLGKTTVVVYEVHPNAWSVIVNTLVDSAKSLTLIP